MAGEHIMVVAIDFGTTYSGFAFSFRSDFEKDPLNIKTVQPYTSEQKYNYSLKTPTTLLLDKAGGFIAFGYDAELRYNNIALDGTQKDFLYFERFKMSLYNNEVRSFDMFERHACIHKKSISKSHGHDLRKINSI